jgi:hypothetical protein
MGIYRSAQGKKVDMARLMAQNEKVQAVGIGHDGKKTSGLKVNARGDLIDNKGNVVKSINQKRSETYGKTVGNKSAQGKTMHRPAAATPAPKQSLEEIEAINSMNDMLDEDDAAEVEQIKAQESKK